MYFIGSGAGVLRPHALISINHMKPERQVKLLKIESLTKVYRTLIASKSCLESCTM
jgi:hypothetical protein